MERKRFGKAKADDIVRRFNGLTEQYKAAGYSDPEMHAMTRAFAEFEERQADRAKVAMDNLVRYADLKDRFDNPLSRNRAKFGQADNEHLDPGRQAISILDHDQGAGGIAYELDKRSYLTGLWAIGGDIIKHARKGVFGTQKGKAHLENMVRESFGETTKDRAALEMVTAWRKMTDAGVDFLNNAGGALKKLATWHMPQKDSATKISIAGFDHWAKLQGTGEGRLDWSKMFWPDGSPIPEAERMNVLREVFKTKSTGGLNKIDASSLGGRGANVGNMLDQHRFLVYRDADAWLANHNDFGEGNIFDVMDAHVEDMAKRIATQLHFGRNPQLGAEQIKKLAISRAAAMDLDPNGPKLSGTSWVNRTKSNLATFDAMFDRQMQRNPMNPDSFGGNLVHSVGNILSAAQMGGAVMLSAPGDFANAAMVAQLNGMGLLNPVKHYMHYISGDAEAIRRSVQFGIIQDQMHSRHYAATRYSGFNMLGPAWSRNVSDVIIRGSGLSATTEAMRYGVGMEMMGFLAEVRNTKFDDLPINLMLRRYGIDEAAWDAFRSMPVHREGIGEWLRPVDLLKSGISDKETLYRRFQGMLHQETRNMVVEGNAESAISLKGNTRPDTLFGAILHSFAMYKAFPIAFMNTHGRLAMSSTKGRLGRLSYYARLGTVMFMSAALGIQMREILQGRDPIPMDNPRFYLKAFLASGGLSIWGDFLYSSAGYVTPYGQGPEEVAAGPIVSAAGDTVDLAITAAAEGFGWVTQADWFLKQRGWKTDDKIVQFTRRNYPGSTLWYTRLLMQRAVFDGLAEMADPRAYQKRKARAKQQRDTWGNESWWSEGEALPHRAPDFSHLLGVAQ